MTTNQQAVGEGFVREERFIVIKRKHLTEVQEKGLRDHMARLGIDTVESVVVESDWPEYETVWRMIEDRVTGRAEATRTPAAPDVVEHTCPHCDAQVLLMGAHYLDRITEALDAVGAPKKSPDGNIHYSIFDRIEALQPDAVNSRGVVEKLEDERNELNNSFGQGPARDGQIQGRIAEIDAVLSAAPAVKIGDDVERRIQRAIEGIGKNIYVPGDIVGLLRDCSNTLAAKDAEIEAARLRGQAEGKAAVVNWLRERLAMKPTPMFAEAASMLATLFEQSEQPATGEAGK